jgi:hypothetical protein
LSGCVGGFLYIIAFATHFYVTGVGKVGSRAHSGTAPSSADFDQAGALSAHSMRLTATVLDRSSRGIGYRRI